MRISAEDRNYASVPRSSLISRSLRSLSLEIISMKHQGSLSKSTRACWDARVLTAQQRQMATTELPTPLSVMKRLVLQTLAIVLWRINASRTMQFHRRACLVLCKYGTALV